MEIINTFIVCRITKTIFRVPKFFKVYEIKVDETGKTGFILDDRGDMELITKHQFNELQNNMKELGL